MSLISKISLKDFDVLGSQIQFFFKEKNSLKTHFGGFFSILMFFACIVMFFIFGEDLFYHNKPLITFSKQRFNKTNLMFNEFPVLIYPVTSAGKPVAIDRLMKVELDVQSVGLLSQKSVKPVDLVPCSQEYLGKWYNIVSIEFDFNYLRCINLPKNGSFSNDRASLNSTWLSMRIHRCTNGSTVTNCLPEEQIQASLNEIYIGVCFINYFTQPVMFEKPATPYLYKHLQMLGLRTMKRRDFKFKTVVFETDIGIFNEDIETYKTYELESKDFEMDVNSQTSTKFFQATFENINLGDIYARKYVKFSTILSSFGGMMNIIYTILLIICNYISQTSFFLQVSRETINFSAERDELNEINSSCGQMNSNLVMNKSNEVNDLGLNRVVIIPFKFGEGKGKENSNKDINCKVKGNFNNDETRPAGDSHHNQKSAVEDINITNNQPNSHFLRQYGVVHYLKNLICAKKRGSNDVNDLVKHYEFLIEYSKKRLDIVEVVKLGDKIAILKSLIVGNYSDCFDKSANTFMEMKPTFLEAMKMVPTKDNKKIRSKEEREKYEQSQQFLYKQNYLSIKENIRDDDLLKKHLS